MKSFLSPAIGIVLFAATALSVTTPVRAQTTTVFTYTGAVQNFTVPAGVTSMRVQLYGAGGGDTGGSGAYVSGLLAVTPLSNLSIIVGGGGHGYFTNASGGFGGGGDSFNDPITDQPNGSGGGRSAIRLGTTEIVTAGGGGGGYEVSDNALGGYINPNGSYGLGRGGGGGITTGMSGSGSPGAGGGGTQSAGGVAGGGNALAGSQFQGGNGASPLGAGGGGGYFGGGGGYYAAGGGGSSYVALLSSAINESGAIGNFYGTPRPLPGGTSSSNYIAGVGTGGTGAQNGGNGLVVLTVSAPEPASIAFVLTGGIGVMLGVVRNRKKVV